MKILLFLCALSAFSLADTHLPDQFVPLPSGRPTAEASEPEFSFSSERSLTAKEVESGDWVSDDERGCDFRLGCPYKNKKTGEVGYLPESEKKLLKAGARKEADEDNKENGKGKITELKDKMSWDEKFDSEKGKKGLVLIFSAEDCGPCKGLKAKLEKSKLSDVSVFTAVRPTYRNLQGHALHEAFKSSIGGSVPVAFIYTPDENGKWKGSVAKGNKIFPAIEAIR